MPNWCENKLFARHDAESLDKLETAFKAQKPFETFMPIPEGLIYEMPKGIDPSDLNALQENQESLNQTKYGFKSWHEWCISNWGTKWDASDVRISDRYDDWIEIYFNTAWGPPIGFYKHLETIGFKVRGMYYEPGVGFAGLFENGDDKCWSDLSADDLDPHVREEMGIPWGDEDEDDE